MLPCLICGQLGEKLFSVKSKILAHCIECDLSWTDNFRKPHYNDYHLDTTYTASTALFDNIFRRLYRIAAAHFEKPGEVLEVGSSVGNMLHIFKQHGWQVLGVEPSKKACTLSKKMGLAVKNGYVEDVKLPKSHFDLIIINQTLEHLNNPHKILVKIKSYLKPNGILMIGVPNFGSLSAKILKNKWYYILPDEHKWHFSPISLAKLLKKSGFSIMEYHAVSGVFDYDNPFEEIKNSLFGHKKRFFSELFTLPTSYILSKLHLGTGLVMLARKE
jgi:2-polyprenyl-3-methyl-5-hydroxy-6-metoxy-1,4-benzoquinol methylase